MIWEKKVFEHRSLEEWIEGIPLPIGIEELVPTAKLLPVIQKQLLKGVLLLTDPDIGNHVVAGVLKGLKDHAEDMVCFTASQALLGLERRRKWSEADIVPTTFEAPDLLILLAADSLRPFEEQTIDGVLASRGLRPPRVTVLVGKPGGFPVIRGIYGENRTHELRSKTTKKST